MTGRSGGKTPVNALTDRSMPGDAFAIILTKNSMSLPLRITESSVYCWPVYLRGPGPAGSRISFDYAGRSWVRASTMHYREIAPLIDRLDDIALTPGLGKICHIHHSAIEQWLSTREPEVRAANADTLTLLAYTLDVPAESIGLTGSSLYRPPAHRSDVDFVVYGEQPARRAFDRIHALLQATEDQYYKDGQLQHWRFRIPGSPIWFDPRFPASEDLTAFLTSGEPRVVRREPLDGLEVVDDRRSIFYPSRYGLADGSVLLSYRLGHNGLFRCGDALYSDPLPVYDFGGAYHRLCVLQDEIQIHRPANARRVEGLRGQR
jgi:hypothetical protein